MKNLYDQSTQFFDAQSKNGAQQFEKAFQNDDLTLLGVGYIVPTDLN